MDERVECIYECGNQATNWAWQTTNTWHPICYDCLPQWWDGDRCSECGSLNSGETCEAHRRKGYPNPWYRTWEDIPAGYQVYRVDGRAEIEHTFITNVGLVPSPNAAADIRNEFLALIGLADNLKENADA